MENIKYGLIGKKLGHSFSPQYFNTKFQHENIPSQYYLFEIPHIERIIPLIRENPDLRGLNITIPYKQEVIPLLSHLSPTAEAIGAVNTIRIERGDHEEIFLFGHNTDAVGFLEAIRPLLGDRRHALMLGLGGASKAVEYALNDLGVSVTKVSRRSAPGVLTYDCLSAEVMQSHDIIVNCTPLGMWPETDKCPDIPYDLIDSRYLCFDLIYNPETTKFMQLCSMQGAEVSNGLAMLHNQADAAYSFWNTREFKIENFSESMIAGRRSIMSREIFVEYEGMTTCYFLSIAEISLNIAGEIIKIIIEPFEKEKCNVEYIDSPVTLHLGIIIDSTFARES